MSKLRDRIIFAIQESGLPNSEIDAASLADQALPSAWESIVLHMVENELDEEARETFRDSYLLAPDVFDPEEYLRDQLPDYEVLEEKYASDWLALFEHNLKR